MENNCEDRPDSYFRKYGFQLVDRIADYLDNIEKYPVQPKTEAGEIKNALETDK